MRQSVRCREKCRRLRQSQERCYETNTGLPCCKWRGRASLEREGPGPPVHPRSVPALGGGGWADPAAVHDRVHDGGLHPCVSDHLSVGWPVPNIYPSGASLPDTTPTPLGWPYGAAPVQPGDVL